MKVKDLIQGSEAWLEWRRGGITATDAVVLAGCSEHKTLWRLWAEKSGYCQEVDLSRNPIVRAGLENEDTARQSYENAHDDMLLPLCAEWDDDSLFRASFDGIDQGGVAVEIKCPHETTWRNLVRFLRNSEPFQRYVPQVQHQMLVTGKDHGILVFWYEGEREEFVIDRDQQMIDTIIVRGHELMTMVRDKTPPPKDPEKDLFMPQEQQVKDWIFHAQEYRRRQEKIAKIKAEMDALKAEQAPHLDVLTDMMGIYRHADYAGVLVTRYKQKGRVNYEQILDEVGWEGDTKQYQDTSTERVRVTLTESVAPRDVVEPDVIAQLESVPLRCEPDDYF